MLLDAALMLSRLVLLHLLLELHPNQHVVPDTDLLAVCLDLHDLISRVRELATSSAGIREVVEDLGNHALVEGAALVNHDELIGREGSGIDVVEDVVAEVLTAVVAVDVDASDGVVQVDDLDEVLAADELGGDGLLCNGSVEVVLLDPLDQRDGGVVVGLEPADQHGIAVVLDEDLPSADALLSLSFSAELEQLLVVDVVGELDESGWIGLEVDARDFAGGDGHFGGDGEGDVFGGAGSCCQVDGRLESTANEYDC